MRKVIYRLHCWLWLLVAAGELTAQDFLLQGCYWDCPESSNIEIDEASLTFWTAKIKAQAPELGHNGFSYIWLPPANSATPGIRALINDLNRLGIQTIADLQLTGQTDTNAVKPNDFTPQWLSSASNLGVQAYQVNQDKAIQPDQIGALLNGFYEKNQIPGLFITTPPEKGNPSKGASWVNKIIQHMKAEAARIINPRIHDQMLREALRKACADPGYDTRNIFANSLRDATSLSGFNVITFVNSPEYRNQNGIPNDADDLIADPLLAYVYTLTNNQLGLPAVFYADYYGGESEADLYLDKEPLKEAIDQLMKTHKQYIFNSHSVEYLNAFDTEKSSVYLSSQNGVDASNVLIFQMDGSNTPAGIANKPRGKKDVIVAINFARDTLKLIQEINMSNIDPTDYFTDILGLSNSPETNVSFNTEYHIPNSIYIELPPRSYSIWVQGHERPVIAEFIEFTAEAYDDYVELSWEIPSEKAIQGYEVQRSVNRGLFEKIAWIEADHFTEEGASFIYIDKDITLNTTLHYRIKLIDNEGNYEYSQTEEIEVFLRQLSFEISDGINAAIKTIKVESNTEDTAELAVFNAEGARVLYENHHISKGVTHRVINLQNLPAGVYILNYTTHGRKSWTTRFLKL